MNFENYMFNTIKSTGTILKDGIRKVRPVIETLIVIGLLYAGYLFGKHYPTLFEKATPTLTVTESSTHSVSVTDRGELIILNRSTGEVQLYSQAVGENVFRSYASRIVQTPR